MAPLANPPVCRIMDYGKYKFDEAQRAKESRRKTTSVGIKEMKYRPKIGPGDFDTKTRQVLKFLNEGHKVKVTIMFRGREVFHPELGKKILDRVAEQVDGTARVESEPRLDGRNMVMVLAPDKRAKQSAAARAAAARRRRPAATAGSAAGPTGEEHGLRRCRESNGGSPAEAPAAATGDAAPGRRGRNADMPKMKTDRGAAKRFKVTGTGRLRRRQAYRSHLLEKKSSTRTRRLGREVDVAAADRREVRRLLGR